MVGRADGNQKNEKASLSSQYPGVQSQIVVIFTQKKIDNSKYMKVKLIKGRVLLRNRLTKYEIAAKKHT